MPATVVVETPPVMLTVTPRAILAVGNLVRALPKPPPPPPSQGLEPLGSPPALPTPATAPAPAPAPAPARARTPGTTVKLIMGPVTAVVDPGTEAGAEPVTVRLAQAFAHFAPPLLTATVLSLSLTAAGNRTMVHPWDVQLGVVDSLPPARPTRNVTLDAKQLRVCLGPVGVRALTATARGFARRLGPTSRDVPVENQQSAAQQPKSMAPLFASQVLPACGAARGEENDLATMTLVEGTAGPGAKSMSTRPVVDDQGRIRFLGRLAWRYAAPRTVVFVSARPPPGVALELFRAGARVGTIGAGGEIAGAGCASEWWIRVVVADEGDRAGSSNPTTAARFSGRDADAADVAGPADHRHGNHDDTDTWVAELLDGVRVGSIAAGHGSAAASITAAVSVGAVRIEVVDDTRSALDPDPMVIVDAANLDARGIVPATLRGDTRQGSVTIKLVPTVSALDYADLTEREAFKTGVVTFTVRRDGILGVRAVGSVTFSFFLFLFFFSFFFFFGRADVAECFVCPMPRVSQRLVAPGAVCVADLTRRAPGRDARRDDDPVPPPAAARGGLAPRRRVDGCGADLRVAAVPLSDRQPLPAPAAAAAGRHPRGVGRRARRRGARVQLASGHRRPRARLCPGQRGPGAARRTRRRGAATSVSVLAVLNADF
jgi:hypothetical protein